MFGLFDGLKGEKLQPEMARIAISAASVLDNCGPPVIICIY
jgi:hypothetical protein